MTHHVSMPHVSWDLMLKITGVQIPLINDHAMFQMIHRGIRGGVATIIKRYSRANNPKMGLLYKESRRKKWIIYLDVNNLYGWAMSQMLPLGNFRYLSGPEMRAVDWDNWDPFTSPKGYFMLIDLRYPGHLHNEHNEYPLAPDRLRIKSRMFTEEESAAAGSSERERRMHVEDELGNVVCDELVNEPLNNIQELLGMPAASNNTKLSPHLGWRRRYFVHGATCKFYLEHGLKLHHIRAVIEYDQSRWMAPYIEECARRRKAASNEFEQELFKLLPNSAYGIADPRPQAKNKLLKVNIVFFPM
jgi:hypothetical protein